MLQFAAGITVYEPDIERLNENTTAVLSQTERVYIVDNASSNSGAFKAKFRDNEQVVIIENEKNEGVAKALNQMCEMALSDGFKWILLLDQDSVPETDIIKKFSRYTDKADVAIITPRYIDDNEPEVLNSESLPEFEFVSRCDTSASLVNLEIYKQLGGFDEDMFIDYVDFDYCTTAEKNGYLILRDNEAILHHRLGHAEEITFFMPIGRIFGIKKLQKVMFTYNHSPLRTYYYVRNAKYYRYKHADAIDIKKEKKTVFRWMALKLMFEKEKFQKLKAAIKGSRDADKMIEKLKNTEKSEE